MTRRDKIFALSKGFRGRSNNNYKLAWNRVEKALQYAYRDRRTRKRVFRTNWIRSINAASVELGVKYSQFIHGLALSNVLLNRKMLAELAVTEPLTMRSLVALSVHSRRTQEPSDFKDWDTKLLEWPSTFDDPAKFEDLRVDKEVLKRSPEYQAKIKAENAKKQAARLANQLKDQADKEARNAEISLTFAEML